MIQKGIFSVKKVYGRYTRNQNRVRRDGFVKSLNSIQLFYFQQLEKTLVDYHKECIAFKQDNLIIVEYKESDMTLLFSINLAASECMMNYTKVDLSETSIKHVETRYFNTHASIIFDEMLEECLKRKRRDHEAMRNSLIKK